MKIILQHDQRDCGAACLSMIATYYGLKMPLSNYRELTKTDRMGTTLYGLVNGAQQIGLEARGLSGTPQDLIEGIQRNELTFPFIAHVVSDGIMLHYVVVFGQKKGRFLIGDPSKGKIRLTLEAFFQQWTGYLVTFKTTPAFVPSNKLQGSFTKFFLLLKGQYRKLIGVFLISLGISAIGILGAFVFEIVIDNFALNTGYDRAVETTEIKNDTFFEDSSIGIALSSSLGQYHFNTIFIALICLYLLQAFIQFIRGSLIISVAQKIDMQLSIAYYCHIIDLPISSATRLQTGEYLSRFSDISTIRQAISSATLTLLLDSIMVIACGILLFFHNKQLFFISSWMLLFYTLIILIYRKPVTNANRHVMENNAQLHAYFKESIDGLETVKATCAHHIVKEKTISKFQNYIASVVRNSLIALSQDTLADTVELIGTVLILWLGFSMVLSNQITIGSLMTFYALLAYFTNPIKNLIELQPTIQTALVAADRLNDILDLHLETNIETADTLPQITQWSFEHVDFRYGNHELVLKDVSFRIKQGQKIAIVGESAVAKQL